jgi:FkbM family methyltransferase
MSSSERTAQFSDKKVHPKNRQIVSLALKTFPRIARFIRRARGRILHRPDLVIAYETIGSIYGSHTLPQNLLTDKSNVYSFGIGTDVSFDLGVISRYGCIVHGFDPTPKCVEWVTQNEFDPKFLFHPLGIGAEDNTVSFQSPLKSGHVSFSRASKPEAGIELPVMRLQTIMDELQHRNIDVLKMDVEGFEYEAITDMLDCRIHPSVVAVEFHHAMYGIPDEKTNEAVAHLRKAGYRLFFVSETGREYSFVREN